VSEVKGGAVLALAGALNIHTVGVAEKSIQTRARAKTSRAVDLSDLGQLDTPGASATSAPRKGRL
jgi:ABC-type transporter Mla MlaB component